MRPNLLDLFFKCAKKDLEKKIFSNSLEAVLNIFLKSSLSFVVGPTSLLIPYSKIISWFYEVGYDVNHELGMMKGRHFDYNLYKESGNNITAELITPIETSNFTLMIPDSYKFYLDKEFNLPSLQDYCVSCKTFGNHLWNCPLQKCEECGERGVCFHKPLCTKNQLYSWNIANHEKCIRCGAVIYVRPMYYFKNINKEEGYILDVFKTICCKKCSQINYIRK